MSQAISPPSIYFDGINFNSSFYEQTPSTGGSGFTEAQANILYLKKQVDDTSVGKPTFTNGLLSNDYEVNDVGSSLNIGLNATNLTVIQLGNDQCSNTNLYNVTMNNMDVHGSRQVGSNLTNWNVYANFNPDWVGEYQEIIGYSITPTLNANSFYPVASNPINVLKPGLYNLKVSFQFTATAVTGSFGQIAFGVTTSSLSATGWLYANNGNLTGSLFRNHVPNIVTADLPMLYNVDFNFVATGLPFYFKYYIQSGGSVTGGSLIMSYYIMKLC
jgi:hypothetical protein